MFSRVVCTMCIELECTKLNNDTFYWNYIKNYENLSVLKLKISDVKVSDFTPFIRLWIVFFNSVTKIFWPASNTISFLNILKSRLTNISYKDVQNLSSPSDGIQFSIRSDKRMVIPSIIHISDLRNSTINWS